MNSKPRKLAMEIDAALDTLNGLAQAYLVECARLNADHVVCNRYNPHPVYAEGSHNIRGAVGARHHLARALSLSLCVTGFKLADIHPE